MNEHPVLMRKKITDEWVTDGGVYITRNMEGVVKQMIIQANPYINHTIDTSIPRFW